MHRHRSLNFQALARSKAILEIFCGKLAEEAPGKKMAREAFFLVSLAVSQGETFGTKCCRRLAEMDTDRRRRVVLEKFHHDGAMNRFEQADSPLLPGQYRAQETTWSFVLFSAGGLVFTTGFPLLLLSSVLTTCGCWHHSQDIIYSILEHAVLPRFTTTLPLHTVLHFRCHIVCKNSPYLHKLSHTLGKNPLGYT